MAQAMQPHRGRHSPEPGTDHNDPHETLLAYSLRSYYYDYWFNMALCRPPIRPVAEP
ncbi:hypothetical protein GCM10020219_086100 [Nonomuraea dietziae]